MLEEARKGLQDTFGVTNEEFAEHVSYPHNRKIIEKRAELSQYRIIAEVIKAKYCSAGMKIGNKLVLQALPAVLIPEESDCPLCLRALGPLANLVSGFWDRLIDDRDPNEGMWYISECLDPGLDKGGLGHVVFKVYARKVG
jgi:uncharacterized repeat protein (TIGR04076 family)